MKYIRSYTYTFAVQCIAFLCALLVTRIESCPGADLHVLLMTYNRVHSANRVIWQLRRLLKTTSSVRLVIAQNHASGDNYTHDLARILKAEHGGMFCSVQHVVTPMFNEQGASSYGSKRNAQNNLLHGLRAVFGSLNGTAPNPGRRLAAPAKAGRIANDNDRNSPSSPLHAIILEDDLELSPDSMEYFAFAGSSSNLDGVNPQYTCLGVFFSLLPPV